MQEIINYYTTIELFEWIAVLASIAYVVLASHNNILCWPAAITSTVFYTVVFYDYYLWSDSALQIYYLAMALYGWSCWQPHSKSDDSINSELSNVSQGLTITSRALSEHIKPISLLTIISLIVGFLMAKYTPTDFPYIDAATTVFAIYATYLVTQKVLENWLYWVVIDFVSIYVYAEKGLVPTAFLFFLFVVLASFGYFKWRKLYAQEQQHIQNNTLALN